MAVVIRMPPIEAKCSCSAYCDQAIILTCPFHPGVRTAKLPPQIDLAKDFFLNFGKILELCTCMNITRAA
jgi:hypothetical protein